MKDGLSRAVKAGVSWVMIERLSLQFLQVITSVILARILSPSDFGVMALAVVFTGLASRLMRFGFGMALIQRESIRPDHVSTLFVITLIINGGIWLGLTGISPHVGVFFDNPLVGEVLAILSLNFLIRCLGACPSALLRREMNFKAPAVGSFLDCGVKLFLTVILAFQGFGVWSLVYGELTGAAAKKAYLILVSGWRPSLRVTQAAVRDLFCFGVGISLKSTFIYVSENVDNFVIGKWLGPASLGYYEKAYALMNRPVQKVSGRMNAVLFPAFARIHQDPGRLRAAFRKTVLSLSLVCYPIFGSMFVLGPQIIQVMYGPQWAAAVVPFQLLCLAGLPRSLTRVTSSLINATGSVGPEVKVRAITFILLILGTLLGSRWGIIGVAMAVVIVNLFTLTLILFLLARVCSIPLKDALSPQGIPLAGTFALIGIEKACQMWTVQSLGLNAFAVLLISLTGGSLVYVAIIHLMRDRALEALIEELKADLRPVSKRLSVALPRLSR